MKNRILIVDDYRDSLDMWGLYLESRGYEVLTAADGIEALNIAAAEHPDLIVLDIELPGVSGIEVARQLRAGRATAGIPLIAATGRAGDHDLADARSAGFDAVMVKPCEPSMLVDEIERLLGRAETGELGQQASHSE